MGKPSDRVQQFLASPTGALSLLSLVLLLWLLPLLAPALREPLAGDARIAGAPAESALFHREGEWIESDGTLRPADEWTMLRAVFPGGTWDTFHLKLRGSGEWSARLQCGTERLTLPRITPGDDRTTHLQFKEAASELLVLEITPAAGSVGAELRLVDARLSLEAVNQIPNGAGALVIVLFPWGAFCFSRVVSRWSERKSLVLAMALGAVAGLAARGEASILSGMAPTVVVLGLATVLSAWRRGLLEKEGTRQLVCWGAVVALLAAALATRWDGFELARRLPLRPDAEGYLAIVARGGGLYATELAAAPWIREPLWPWVLRVTKLGLPDSSAAMQFFSMILSLVPVVLTWLLARRWMHPLGALLAAGVLAVNREWGDLAAAVLREDLALALLLGVGLLHGHMPESPKLQGAAAGLLTGALAMLRLGYLPFALMGLLWIGWRARWRWETWGIALGIFLLPLLPHLVVNHRLHGDALYSVNVHTVFYANREFAGKPGWPSREEVRADPYAGGPVSLGTYVRELGFAAPVTRVAQGMMFGAGRDFTRGVLFPGAKWWLLPLLPGFLWLLWDRRALPFALWTGSFALPAAFVWIAGVDWRFWTPVAPMVAMLWGAGITEPIRWIAARRGASARPAPTADE